MTWQNVSRALGVLIVLVALFLLLSGRQYDRGLVEELVAVACALLGVSLSGRNGKPK